MSDDMKNRQTNNRVLDITEALSFVNRELVSELEQAIAEHAEDNNSNRITLKAMEEQIKYHVKENVELRDKVRSLQEEVERRQFETRDMKQGREYWRSKFLICVAALEAIANKDFVRAHNKDKATAFTGAVKLAKETLYSSTRVKIGDAP